jgi:MoxR-like ATPase
MKTQIQIKRGRGRPRKNPIVTLEPVVKRGRGRPRKHPLETVAVIKRGRGRPRKIVSETVAPTQNEPVRTNGDLLKVYECKNYIQRKFGETNDIEIIKFARNKGYNVLLIGDTGTGKTHAIRFVAKQLGLPYKRINLDGMITVEDLIGEYKPTEDKHFTWKDGVLTKFVKNGGIFVCDEINSAPADILFLLHSLLDDERQIVIRQHEGEVIKAHKDFFFIATMNPDYEGTKPMNEALKDRFHIILNYDYDNKIEGKLVENKKLIELANKLREMYRKREIETPVSTRQLIQYEENEKHFGTKLAQEFFVNRFALSERRAVSECIDVSLNGKKIKTILNEDEDD